MGKDSRKVVIRRIDKTMSKGPQLEGLRTFKVRLKNVKMGRERCEKIRKFLQRQSDKLGRPIGDILSQSLTPREVSLQNTFTVYPAHMSKKVEAKLSDTTSWLLTQPVVCRFSHTVYSILRKANQFVLFIMLPSS